MPERKGTNHRSASRILLSILMLSIIPAVCTGAILGSPQGAGTPGDISVSPGSVVLDTKAGATVGLTSDIEVSSTAGGSLGYTATVQSIGGWLQLANVLSGLTVSLTDTLSATAPGSLRIFAFVEHLSVGTYHGTVTLSTPGSSLSPEIIPVILVVRGEPAVILRPSAIKLQRRNGIKFNPPPSQTVSVFGERTAFKVQVSAETPGWLTVTPSSATTPADLSVSVQPAGLDSGSYQATVSIMDTNGRKLGSATVSLDVTDSIPSPTVSPTAISFRAFSGSREPLSKKVEIFANDLPVSLANSVADAPWLSVEVMDQWAGAFDGKTETVLPQPGRLTISADPTGLAPGTYSGHVQIGDLSDPTVPVTLNVVSSNLIVPRVVDGGGWDSVITLVNTDAVPASYALRFWQQDGTPMSVPLDNIGTVSSYTDEIPVGGTRTLKTTGLNATIVGGWAEVIAQASIGGTATLRQHGRGGSEVAVPIAVPSGKSLTFPFDNLGGFQTGAALVNGGESDCTVAVSASDEDGRPIVSDSITLPAHGSPAFFLQGKYPELVNRRGEIRFDSGVDFSAVALRFSPRGAFSLLQPIQAQSGANEITTQYVPRISDGTAWKTTLLLENPSIYPVPFSIVFRDPATPGTLLKLPILGVGTASEYSDVIPAGGARTIETPGTAKSLVEGWAEIVSQGPIAGTVVLTHTAGSADAEATMQIRPGPGERFVLPFDNSGGYATGLAILNAAKSDWIGTVIVRGESGERLDTEYFPAGGGTSQAFMLTDRFQATKGIRGTLEFLGVDLSVLGARFNPAGSFSLVTPIPK